MTEKLCPALRNEGGTFVCERLKINLANLPNNIPLKAPDCQILEQPSTNCEITKPSQVSCPDCGSSNVTSIKRDAAFSVHYIDDRIDYKCHSCPNEWEVQEGYRGVA